MHIRTEIDTFVFWGVALGFHLHPTTAQNCKIAKLE